MFSTLVHLGCTTFLLAMNNSCIKTFCNLNRPVITPAIGNDYLVRNFRTACFKMLQKPPKFYLLIKSWNDYADENIAHSKSLFRKSSSVSISFKVGSKP